VRQRRVIRWRIKLVSTEMLQILGEASS
jgi:hypothetical protein